jgi:hypothetical protein
MKRALWSLLLLSPLQAQADTPPPPVRRVEVVEAPRTEGDDILPEDSDLPRLALRFFPIRLLGGVGLGGVEVRVLPSFSLLAQVGYGRVSVLGNSAGEQVRRGYFEAEAQGRYYAIGSIRGGLYTGLALSYARVDTHQLITSPLFNLASGLHLGPSLGGTYLLPWSIQFDLQFVLPFRLHRPALSTPDPPEADTAARLRVGVTSALGIAF